MSPQVRPAGDSAILLELESLIDVEVNARAIGIAVSVRAMRIDGVRDVVPTFRSVAVHFDPLRTDLDRLIDAMTRAASERPADASSGRTIEVPVQYGGEAGPDLAAVAELTGLGPEEVIACHTGQAYRVFMMGFMPGFAYLGPLDPRIAVPRRSTPRVRVPARSVGLADRQTGIYPRESPGGWQVIGRAGIEVFDTSRSVPALFAPGDQVRFVSVPDLPTSGAESELSGSPRQPEPLAFARTISVLRPGLLTTIQDVGRWGHQDRGVSAAGPMDMTSHRLANLIVGNPQRAATLEATLVGPELRMDAQTIVAIAGADLGATLDGRGVPLNEAVGCPAGSILRFGERRSGTRAYLGIAGGVDVPRVLGSRATHVASALGGIGGRPLRQGDRLPIGQARRGPWNRSVAPRSIHHGGARVRVLPGPQAHLFAPSTMDDLRRTRFTVSPRSDRMGYRLSGARMDGIRDRQMISDAAFAGSVQIPPSGEPILLMSDGPTTGGYPQIVTVITADRPLAGQLGPGDWIEFEVCSREEAVAALIAREGELRAIG